MQAVFMTIARLAPYACGPHHWRAGHREDRRARVDTGAVRADLYYRLSGFQRAEDIEELASIFAREFVSRVSARRAGDRCAEGPTLARQPPRASTRM